MRRREFTLLKLASVVAILAVLVAVPVPSLGRYVARVQLLLIAKALASDLRQMHAEAEVDSAFHTIAFGTNEKRYYFREGTRSWMPVTQPGQVQFCTC